MSDRTLKKGFGTSEFCYILLRVFYSLLCSHFRCFQCIQQGIICICFQCICCRHKCINHGPL